MSGEDLLKAVGEADERYVQEAETLTLTKPKFGWVRWAAAAAACFAVVLSVGLVIGPGNMENVAMDGASEMFDRYPGGDSNLVLQAPEAEMETVAGWMPMESKGENVPEETVADGLPSTLTPPAEPVGTEPANDQIAQEVPSVLLRIDAWLDNGFEATVEEIVDTDIYPVGTKLQVEFRKNIRIVERNGDLIGCCLRTPTQEDFPAGSVVQILFSIRDDGVLLVEQIGKEDAF